MFAVTNWLDQGLLVLLLPLWARSHGSSPAVVGAEISAAGAVATLTALTTAYIGHRLPRRATYLIGSVISGATRFAVLATGFPQTIVIIAYAIAGLGSGLINPLMETVQLERIPAAVRGRALTLIGAAAWIGIPAGGATAAALANALGVSDKLWLCACLYLAAVLLPAWQVTWHARPVTLTHSTDRPSESA
jgi:MFS family permease